MGVTPFPPNLIQIFRIQSNLPKITKSSQDTSLTQIHDPNPKEKKMKYKKRKRGATRNNNINNLIIVNTILMIIKIKLKKIFRKIY